MRPLRPICVLHHFKLCHFLLSFHHLLALIKGDLDTVLLRDEVGHLLLHIIAVLEYLRGALELRHSLEDIDTLHVRDKLTHLVRNLQDREL